MKFLLSVFLAVVVAPTFCAASRGMDGNKMLEDCQPLFDDSLNPQGRKALDAAYCAGYVDGVLETHGMWKAVEGKTSQAAHYCMPAEVPNGQVLKIIKKWLDENPERLHWSGEVIIHKALMQAFPCH